MPNSGRAGWGRAGHRRAVLAGALVALLVLGGGATAWAEVSGGSTGYRMASVTRADIGTTLTVVGNVEPVSDASPAFGVGGQVTSVTVSPGQLVSAGQTLATLDTTAMNESVSSDQSTLAADEAKLAEDEASQSSAASSSPSSASGSSPSASSSSASPPRGSTGPGSSSTTTTTAPGRGSGSGDQGGGSNPVITQDQTTLTKDEAALSKDQQKEAADLTQAQSDCTSANTATPSGQATCESALETVSGDEQVVSTDQSTVSKDETALGQALAAASSGTGSGSTPATSAAANSGSSSTAHVVADLTSAVTGNTGTGAGSGGSSNTGAGSSNEGGGSPTGGGSSANTDTPQQIASDQAAIDTAEANLTEVEQSLNAATLTSPINGTVVSVGINVGDTVSANSSTEIITIIGTNAYEAQATLDSSQVASVKVGQSAAVEVDGVNGTLEGTVAQVGPVQSSSSGYTYPVAVALPATSDSLHAGSAANVVISTGEVSNVVAVPTSAVQSLGTRSYVLELANGQLTRKVITVGMVGETYTQVLSGLTSGQSVVLVDYAEAVPSSNTNTTNLGSFLGGGGGGFGGFGGGFRARISTGGGGGGLGNASFGG